MPVAPPRGVNWGSESAATRAFDDGLGVRRIETDARDRSTVEVLDVARALAAQPAFESEVRAHAGRLFAAAVDGVALVRHVERRGQTLCVVADHVDGLRLPDLLQEAIKGNVPLPQAAALELAGRIIRVVAAMHRVPGLSHGAITPWHVVITRTGGVVLTDAVYGPAIAALQRNREQLWREFRLALPASASLPRFDQRADVAQLGATVLAIALGRTLREGEYPRAIAEVVIAATLAARPGETGTSASALRMWLQEALHLHPRATFASAVDADKAYAEVLGPAASRRGGTAALEAAVRRIFGDTPESAQAAEVAAAWSVPAVVHPAVEFIDPLQAAEPPLDPFPEPVPAHQPDQGGLRSIFRSVLPLFRAS